jgi:uncharacterized protein (TIGR03435 family)
MRGIVKILVLAALPVWLTVIPAAQNKLSFEVVSVRPCRPNDTRGGLQPLPGGQRYVAKCVPLRPLIWTSYWLHPEQILGGPNWIDKDDFYIEGVAPHPSSIAELHVMMQNTFAERFKLQFHHEKKEIEAYVLGLDKNGPKNLREHAPTNASNVAIDQKIDRKPEGVHEVWTANSAPMDFFVWRLGLRFGRAVVDQTGLRAAGYDFDLSWNSPPPRPAGGMTDPALGVPDSAFLDSSGPTIFEAMRDQLGLRLDVRRAPVDILVIDHVERPSEN